MKNIRRVAYIVLILIIAILSFTVYTNANKENPNEQKEKIFTELKYLESKFMNLINTMNNIKVKNYNIEVGSLSKEAVEQTAQNSSSSGQSSQGSSSGGESGEQSSQGGEGQETSQQKEEDQKKFDLKLSGVLTNNEEVNWEYVKNEVELLYTSMPTITLDMYQLQINKDDILNFNQELDNLAIVVKNQNKEETLAQLTKMYEFMPKFFENAADESWYKIVSDTKSNIFKAYSKLDSQNWTEIGNDVQNAISEYTKLMSQTDISTQKQYTINKCYVMVNELQNAVNSQDASVFLIKYKNLIEEIDNL